MRLNGLWSSKFPRCLSFKSKLQPWEPVAKYLLIFFSHAHFRCSQTSFVLIETCWLQTLFYSHILNHFGSGQFSILTLLHCISMIFTVLLQLVRRFLVLVQNFLSKFLTRFPFNSHHLRLQATWPSSLPPSPAARSHLSEEGGKWRL